MDPLTHTLVGASLAETRLARATQLAAATLIIGANLPDIDAAMMFVGSDAARVEGGPTACSRSPCCRGCSPRPCGSSIGWCGVGTTPL